MQVFTTGLHTRYKARRLPRHGIALWIVLEVGTDSAVLHCERMDQRTSEHKVFASRTHPTGCFCRLVPRNDTEYQARLLNQI